MSTITTEARTTTPITTSATTTTSTTTGTGPAASPRRLSSAAHRASSARSPREERRRLDTLAAYRRAALAPSHETDRARRGLVAQVVEQHLDVADAVARRYASAGDEWADIRQVACLGLLKAALRFDHEKGDDFVAFAGPTVSGEVKRHLRDATWAVRPPRRLQELSVALAAVRDPLTHRLGHEPSAEELALRLGEPVAEVRLALRARLDRTAASLDLPIGTAEGTSLGDTIAAADEHEATEVRCELKRAIAQLPDRDRLLVRLRFVDELSQAEIGRVLGVTQMQVSRLLAKVLGRLRGLLSLDEVRSRAD
ncbi:sigma-70 family RNA polymerase sigma factor [uncultured Frigoribacterium sp.]|uniref:sigma-70 family RNA polymerase sigma factor n=1 Tax=uncultured Frigoribacterium sp. TaxID=335377 RepID=UPI0028D785D4|nr:sigma-70 family RNA polymerase sigma factor [uncultured Frigoribacterium sp.]